MKKESQMTSSKTTGHEKGNDAVATGPFLGIAPLPVKYTTQFDAIWMVEQTSKSTLYFYKLELKLQLLESRIGSALPRL